MIEIIGPDLRQWDVGRSVQITGIEADHAHFANKGDSKAVVMDVVDTKAKIPDYLLQTSKQLCVYAVKDGITVESKTFYVKKRERPENYVYEDDQRNYIYELISSAETAINNATNAADRANEAADNANEAAKAFGDIGKNFVKTVNGVGPDENGNVDVKGGTGETTWHSGTEITGTGENINLPIKGAKTGDFYLNTSTGEVYQSTEGGVFWKFLYKMSGSDPDLSGYAKKDEIPKSAADVGADPSGTAESKVSGHNTSETSHNDIRLLIEGLSNRLNALANSEDVDLDQLAELVAYIKNNRELIEQITTAKISYADIIDNLTTSVANKPLSAKQGVALKALIDTLASGKLDASKLTEAINTALAQAKESGEFDGASGVYLGKSKPTDPNVNVWVKTDGDANLIHDIAEVVKAEVPFVKTAEQPTFVNSIDEMTDASKVYVLPDGYMWAYMLADVSSYTFTADDFVAGQVSSTGGLIQDGTTFTRIATTEVVDLTKGTVSIICPSPYEYFLYYFDASNTYIGKTAWKSGNTDDLLKDTIASGTIDGACYVRISLRDSRNASADLSGRIDEFISNVIVSQESDTPDGTCEWKSTGLSYNQPTDYEDRIVALENILNGLETAEEVAW